MLRGTRRWTTHLTAVALVTIGLTAPIQVTEAAPLGPGTVQMSPVRPPRSANGPGPDIQIRALGRSHGPTDSRWEYWFEVKNAGDQPAANVQLTQTQHRVRMVGEEVDSVTVHASSRLSLEAGASTTVTVVCLARPSESCAGASLSAAPPAGETKLANNAASLWNDRSGYLNGWGW